MKTPTEIKTAVQDILSRPNLPNRLQSRANRFRNGKMGLASMLALLESEGWQIEIKIFKPALNGTQKNEL